jgi:hypothetical protein
MSPTVAEPLRGGFGGPPARYAGPGDCLAPSGCQNGRIDGLLPQSEEG